MLKRLSLPLTAGLLALVPAELVASPGSPVAFPAYDTVASLDDYASSEDYATAVADRRFMMERISYRSDGLDVFAYIYRPVVQGKRLPVIVFNRGSWTWPGFAAELVTMANRLARKGYLVVAPMYRGSGGAAGRDEMGGADLNDLMSLLQVIRSMPGADPERLYLYGESRGGMMVYQALRDGFPARAAAVFGAFTDLERMLADPQWLAAASTIWPDLEVRKEEIVARRSAQRWPERISAPIFILHGGDDRLVPVEHALDMAKSLSAAGKSYRLLVVEGEGHTISGRAGERDARVADWFARH